MRPHLLPTMFPFFVISIFILIHAPASLCVDEEYYLNCSSSNKCGNTNISYPFWGQDRLEYCGYPGFEVNCQGDTLEFVTGTTSYRVLDINYASQTLRVARVDYWNTSCPQYLFNTTLDYSIFSYASTNQNLTLYYGCPTAAALPGIPNTQFSCTINETSVNVYYATTDLSNITGAIGMCNNNVIVPILQTEANTILNTLRSAGSPNLSAAIDGGFDLQWSANNDLCTQCANSNGRCGYNQTTRAFICYCSNGTYVNTCGGTPSATGSTTNQVPLKIGLFIAGAAIFGIFIGFLVFYFRQRKNRLAAESQSKDLPTPPSSKGPPTLTTNLSQSIPSYPSSKSDLGKGSTYFGVHVFSYTELEEATNNFDASRELGEGGFGTVYYGVLHDGRVVAVKRLYENNFKRVEQFMNEVEILTRLRHKNLVVLYGCTSKRSRELLLVYEYIPNGTVADHLHGKKANSGKLTWPVRLSIAIETADALAYLHASDIIHRDVKTNNILLDNDFHVKVADFGLSRLFPTDVTHVSTAPQGTPGYVDPEYYQCYQLTDKSDVYSFGVVLIELISSKEAVDTNRHRHDINLANMAVNKIQNHTLHELVDPSLGFETDYAIRRVTTAVAELAFRCLQQERDMRPTMEEVLQVLRGIENEDINAQKPEVVDIRDDDIGLLKSLPPPVSPDSVVTVVTDKWVPNSF